MDKRKAMPNLTPEQRRRKFFYAEQAAELYNDTIECVVPQYQLMHETMIQLLKYHYRVDSDDERERLAQIKGTVLDIGSGTGAESIRVLQEFPNINVVALDLCEPMHKEFQRNFQRAFPNTTMEERCQLVKGDILEKQGTSDFLLKLLPDEEKVDGYIAAISSFTLHHYNLEEKTEGYRRIFEILKKGGVMINGDLFSHESPRLTTNSNNYDMRWIRSKFQNPSSVNPHCFIPPKNCQSLSDAWIKHYEMDNQLDSMKKQMEILTQLNYSEVGNPFRFWQVGIIFAQK